MSLAVIDASVLTAFYGADDPRYDAVVARLRAGDALFAPAHIDAEVVSALRRLARGRPAIESAVPAALHHLAGLPLRRAPLAPLLPRMWELREDLTAYDAAYAALAERRNGTLVTADRKLASAGGPRCVIDVIG
ncbi:type II toxin-antitoxin system VapC family toxin [Nocardioides sp.]|uniref:type II toxin-antitoxin system VapC family toxin n=1 Tax=Nocardioides sp. TaxID=35761 RepID=UPI002618B4CB|nr:type II toxin-antitoxin system VapC family toxin [Nocardioides sp.]MDI6911865.1 type II toxin-antitoxin system VapC family toxin [Nocardioides sp.]